MPKRRGRNELTGLGLRTRKGVRIESEDVKPMDISLEASKEFLLEIEALYTNTMKDMNREWDVPDVREQILNQV